MNLTDETTDTYWGPLHANAYHGDYAAILKRNRQAYTTGAAHGVEPETLFRFDPKGKTLCDIGAGGGWDAAACLGAGATEVFCLEVDTGLIEMGARSFREMEICSCRYSWVDVRSMDQKAFPRFDIMYSRAVFMHLPISIVEEYWRWTAERLKDDGQAHFQLFQVDGRTEFHNSAVRMPDFDAERRLRDCGLKVTARREIRHPHMEPVWTMYELKKGTA